MNKAHTMLDVAIAQTAKSPRRKGTDKEEWELVKAWLDEKISVSSVNTALGNGVVSSAYSFLATRIRSAYKAGKIKVIE